MRKLKTILQSRIFYILIGCFTAIYALIFLNFFSKESIYQGDETLFQATISDYSLSDEKITLKLKGEESLVANLYKKDEDKFNQVSEAISYNSTVTIKGNLTTPKNNTVPNTFNYRQYLNDNDIYYILNIEDITITQSNSWFAKIKNLIRQRIDAIDRKGYILAFILGDKSNIESSQYKTYQICGISHLFALSGMHISLISVLLFLLLKRLNKTLNVVIVNIILIFYGALVLFPASIKRCLLSITLSNLNKIFHLELNSKQVLILVVTLLILSNPKIIYNSGFQYSICTVSGLILLKDFIADENKTKSLLKLNLVAFLFSLPISLFNFYSINLLSILFNLLIVPIFTTIVYPLGLLTFLFPKISFLFEFFLYLLEDITTLFSSLKFSQIFLNFNLFEVFLFYLFLYFAFKRSKKYLIFNILIILIDILIPHFDSNAYLYFFDVGQGDSLLLISPYQKDIIMIDTGGQISINKKENASYHVSDNVITFLQSRGIKNIDLLILSHGDADHAKEVDNYLKYLKIKNLKINEGDLTSYERLALDNIAISDYIPKEVKMSYLNFHNYNDENSNSLFVLFEIYGYHFLTSGDANKKQELDIINKYKLSEIDFLKIGHHGSNTSSSEKFIKVINPKNCFISVGKNNLYGHPKKSVLETLENYCNIYRTDLNGTIEIKINKNNYKIKTYSP